MTPRERILTALNHKEADKIPLDCSAMRSSGISGMSYNRLKKHLGITGGSTKIYDVMQQLSIPEQWYLDRFRIDAVDLARDFANNPEDWHTWTLPDGSPAELPSWLNITREGTEWVCRDNDGEMLSHMPEGVAYFSQCYWPLAGTEKTEFSDLEEYMKKNAWSYMADPLWKNAERPDFYSFLKEKAAAFRQKTDRAVMIGFGGNLFENGQFLYRTDEFLIKLLIEPENMEKLLDKLLEMHLENLEKLLDSIKGAVDIIMFGDDLGTQSAPMIDPDLYHRIFYPRHKKMFQLVKDRTDIKVFLHSCGSIMPFLPDLIDAGLDIINPVQTTADNMNPRALKREYGKDLVFWGGGVDTQHLLPSGTPEEIRVDVRKNAEILMKDGGFVFSQIHNIVTGVPPENITAMYDEINRIRY